MFARSIVRSVARSGFKLQTVAPTVRAFGHHAPAAPASTADVIIHEDDLVESLEWALNSPPNLHQFDEPPIIVEIEHLDHTIDPGH